MITMMVMIFVNEQFCDVVVYDIVVLVVVVNFLWTGDFQRTCVLIDVVDDVIIIIYIEVFYILFTCCELLRWMMNCDYAPFKKNDEESKQTIIK
jgi:hypothetical protein